MSLNLNFINQCVSRGTIYKSRLPKNCSRLHHTINNLVNGPRTKLLYLGEEISYALYENSHVDTITWIDEHSRDHMVYKPEYNLVMGDQHFFKTSLIREISPKLAKKTIVAVMHTRHYDHRNLERQLCLGDDVKIVSKVSIFDKNNLNGWKDGLSVYDLTIIK